MPLKISFAGYNPSAAPVYAMIRKVVSGAETDWWDDTNSQFDANPSNVNREITLNNGAGIFSSVFEGESSADLSTYSGKVRVFIVDNSATAGYVVGSYDVDVHNGKEVEPEAVDETAMLYGGVETAEAQTFLVKVFNPSTGGGTSANVTTTEFGAPGNPPSLTACTNDATFTGSPGVYTVSMTAAELTSTTPVLIRVTTSDGGVGDAFLVFGSRTFEADWKDGGRLDLIIDDIKSKVDTLQATDVPAVLTAVQAVPDAAATADAVWDEALTGHTTAGTAGDRIERLDLLAAGGAGELTAARANKLDQLDAAMSTRATPAQVGTEAQAVIEANHLDHLLAAAYDANNKPGNSGALLNDLVEDDGGVTRYTANALEQASGSGLTSSSIAAAVWDEAQSAHATSGTFGYIATELALVLTNTNALNNDWTDGGRLDLILDAAATSSQVSALNDLSVTDINGVITSYGLDHLVSTAVAGVDVANNSIVAQLVSAGGDWGTFDSATDALESLRNRGDAAWITAAGFSTHSAADVRTEIDSNSTQIAAIVADTNELQTDWTNGGRLDLLLDATSTHSAADVRTEIDSNSTQIAAIVADTGELQTGWASPSGSLFATLSTLSSNVTTIDTNVDDIEATLTSGGTIHTMINNISATPNTLSAEFIAPARTFAFEGDQAKARNVISVAPGDSLTLSGNFDSVLNYETDIATSAGVTVVEGDASDLTLGSPVVSQDHQKIHCKISGWQSGKKYVLRFVATTTDGDTISGDGVVRVR